jgi:AraC-like DNA-binding protein
MPESDAMRGRLYFWDAKVLYLGPGLVAGLHAHHAVQVCIPLGGRVRLRSPAMSRWRSYAGAVIPADLPHESDRPVATMATFWLDAETPAARRLTTSAGGIRPIRPPRLRALVPRLRVCWRDGYDGRRGAELLDEMIGILAPEPGPQPPVDARLACARDLLRDAPSHRLALADVATTVSLSPSRLLHLLRPHLGLPFRRYLLWLRLRDALREMVDGATITNAAHAAGFADAPHLDRTFRRMLGFTPSAALRLSRFVQDRHPVAV